MATSITYYLGGIGAGPAQNKREQWTNATQPSDPTPAGYTAWDQAGNVTTTRALTGPESAQLAALDSGNTSDGNRASLLTKSNNALTVNATYLAIGSPTNAQVVAQVNALTKECNALIRLAINALSDISGT